MNKNNSVDSEVLARLRTLMALERNYLAEERTQLAQFRTGIALALLGPSLGSIYYPLSVDFESITFFNILISFLFAFITGLGIYWIIKSHQIVKNLRIKKKKVKEKELAILQEYPEVCDFLMQCFED
ncbi:MAG: hypothetical protein K9W44_16085 [Candidatus Lokiarchaeota archaeon]|nr:hypothetical protein [Candidatus Harpocratesius repetitus]